MNFKKKKDYLLDSEIILKYELNIFFAVINYKKENLTNFNNEWKCSCYTHQFTVSFKVEQYVIKVCHP